MTQQFLRTKYIDIVIYRQALLKRSACSPPDGRLGEVGDLRRTFESTRSQHEANDLFTHNITSHTKLDNHGSQKNSGICVHPCAAEEGAFEVVLVANDLGGRYASRTHTFGDRHTRCHTGAAGT